MSGDIYRDLQVRLDGYSFGFPAAASGVEIDLLKMLFTEADAALFLSMSPSLETPEEIAGRTGDDPAEIAARLEDMTERGLLFRLKKRGQGPVWGNRIHARHIRVPAHPHGP